MSNNKKRGRPKGSKNVSQTGEVVPSRCKCGSSRRTPYSNVQFRDYSGSGLDFVGIYYRSCKCLDCGQARRDREMVYPARPSNAAQSWDIVSLNSNAEIKSQNDLNQSLGA